VKCALVTAWPFADKDGTGIVKCHLSRPRYSNQVTFSPSLDARLKCSFAPFPAPRPEQPSVPRLRQSVVGNHAVKDKGPPVLASENRRNGHGRRLIRVVQPRTQIARVMISRSMISSSDCDCHTLLGASVRGDRPHHSLLPQSAGTLTRNTQACLLGRK